MHQPKELTTVVTASISPQFRSNDTCCFCPLVFGLSLLVDLHCSAIFAPKDACSSTEFIYCICNSPIHSHILSS
eukprot:m.206077 g.206077  ORF g.206077 m.206077 type:complete len:74 (-) comp13754_c1_seq12:1720-1941(-)